MRVLRARYRDSTVRVVSFDVGISEQDCVPSQTLEAYVGVITRDGEFRYVSNREVEVTWYETKVFATLNTRRDVRPHLRCGEEYEGRTLFAQTMVPDASSILVPGNRYPVVDISRPIRNHVPVDAYITIVNERGELWSLSTYDLLIHGGIQ